MVTDSGSIASGCPHGDVSFKDGGQKADFKTQRNHLKSSSGFT